MQVNQQFILHYTLRNLGSKLAAYLRYSLILLMLSSCTANIKVFTLEASFNGQSTDPENQNALTVVYNNSNPEKLQYDHLWMNFYSGPTCEGTLRKQLDLTATEGSISLNNEAQGVFSIKISYINDDGEKSSSCLSSGIVGVPVFTLANSLPLNGTEESHLSLTGSCDAETSILELKTSSGAILDSSSCTKESFSLEFNASDLGAGSHELKIVNTFFAKSSDQILYSKSSESIVGAIITLSSQSPSTSTSTLIASSSTATVGQQITLTLTVTDAQGNPISGTPVQINSSGSGNSWAPSNSGLTNASGVFTTNFTSTLAESKSFTISLPSALNTLSSTVVFSPGAASKLVFTTQPATTAGASAPFTTQPVVEILDTYDNRITSGVDSTANITMTLSAGSGALGGTTVVAAIGGVATFSNLSIDTIGSGKKLLATKPNLTGSGGSGSLSVESDAFGLAISAPTSMILVAPASSPSDVNTPLFKVTGASSGNTVSLYTDSGCSTVVSTGIANSTGDAFVQPSLSSAGTYTFYFDQYDGVTRSSCSSSSTNYIYQTTPIYVSFSSTGQIFSEGAGAQSLAIQMSSSRSVDTTIYYTLDGGSAESSQYSTSGGGSVLIPAGDTSASIPITILTDPSTTGHGFIQATLTGTNSSIVKVGEISSSRALIKDSQTTSEVATKISIGVYTACVVLDTGVLKCWGQNIDSNLLDGSSQNRPSPIIVDTGNTYKSVAVGEKTICGIRSNDKLFCWGNNTWGTVGDGTWNNVKSSATAVDPANDYSKISLHNRTACAITTTGVLKCWGKNTSGQIGDGSTGSTAPIPTTIDSGTTYIEVATGYDHSCGITSTNELKCWGDNSYGQLGDGTQISKTTPTLIASGTSFIKIAVSYDKTCAISSLNAVLCWGYNLNGSYTYSLTPTAWDNSTTYQEVTVQSANICGRTNTNQIRCSGGNSHGQLGNGNMSGLTSASPATVSTPQLATAIASGTSLNCAITVSGGVHCWGQNFNGTLGTGKFSYNLSPVTVYSNFVSANIQMAKQYGCILSSSGKITCLGAPGSPLGQIKSNTVVTYAPSPIDVSSTISFQKLALGINHACAMTLDNEILCWGNNFYGTLGNGTTTSSQTPVAPLVNMDVDDLFSGAYNSCAISSSGTLKCWGSNTYGQIGDGTTVQRETPVIADTGNSYSSISIGPFHMCGIRSSNQKIACWGDNSSGQLGDGTTTTRSNAQTIDVANSYIQVASGVGHSCGITTSGVLRCWGSNTYGQLGDTTTTQRESPVTIDSGTTYTKIYAAGKTTCGITSTQALKCWGTNTYGQLGNGTQTDSSTPVTVDSGTSYTSASMSTDWWDTQAICGTTSANDLKCWGFEMGYNVNARAALSHNYVSGILGN